MTLKSSLGKNLLILSAVSFLNDTSSELMGALLPLFITELGGGALSIGLLGGLREAVSNFLKILSGYLSDRFNRKKPFVIAGYGVSALFKLLIPFSNSPSQVVIFSSLERLGKGIRTAPRDAILSLSGKVERNFSIHRAFDTFGALAGSLFALFLISKVPVREALIFGALLSLLSLPLLLLIEEPKVKLKKKLKVKVESPYFKRFLLASTLFSLSYISFMFFILKGKEITGSSSSALLLYAFYNLIYALSALLFKNFSNLTSPFKALSIGYALFSLYLITLSLSNSIALLLVAAVLFGISSGITDAGQRSAVGLLTGRAKRGTHYGLFHFLTGTSALVGNVIVGATWSSYQGVTLGILALLSLTSSALTFKLR